MSTKVTLNAGLSFHVYYDMDDRHEEAPPVYLELHGVQVEVRTNTKGGATVIVALPLETARVLGLVVP